MKFILLVIFLFVPVNCYRESSEEESPSQSHVLDSSAEFVRSLSSSSEEEGPVEEGGTIWAVLVAGSNGWYNYRHQADVCHSFHTLVNHGIDPQHIVTMMYDDIAHNEQNPYPGKLFNSPNGSDVYAGVRIDYKGEDVNPQNFEAVLTGNAQMAKGKKVLESTSKDKVFVYFTDHGATGLIAFPDSELTVKELTRILKSMHAKNMYGELTFYLEACESGSMFEHQLAKSMNIYAVTAANDHESSWGCYCETKKLPGNCLGDLFSVNWMEDSDKENLRSETLEKQFEIVRRLTTRSHVENFGNLAIETEHVAEFMGGKQSNAIISPDSPADYAMYPSRDIPLFVLAHQSKMGSLGARHKLHILQKKRRYLEQQMVELVNKVLHDPVNRQRALTTYPERISQMDCHHEVVHTFSRFCFSFSKNPYALKYVFVLANLCEHRIAAERLKLTMMEHCAEVDIEGIV